MLYIILSISLLAICAMSYILFKKDILSPSFITAGMFLFSTVMSILGLMSWNSESKLEPKTGLIIIVGVLSFFFGECLYHLVLEKKKIIVVNKEEGIVPKKAKIISNDIPYYLSIIMLIFACATITFTIIEERRICIVYGHTPTSLTDLLRFYRTKTLLYDASLASNLVEINFIVKQMQKICYLLCVYNIYFFIENVLNKGDIKKTIIYLAILVLTMFSTLLTSSRSLLMHMFVALFVLLILVYREKKISIDKNKIIKFISIGIVGVMVLFYGLTSFVGRKTNMKGLDYITFYLGTPIPSLNRFLNGNVKEIEKSTGENSFYGIFYTLAKFKLIDSYPVAMHKGTVFEGYGGSNVYTAYMDFYLDFGILGVIILNFVFGFSFTYIYYFVKKHSYNKFYVIMFSYYYYVLVDQIRGNQFFNLISVSTISYFVLGFLLYIYYYKFRIRELKKLGRK